MRVAIDASPAVHQTAGVGRYARELLRELVQLPVDDQFLLQTPGPQSAIDRFLNELPPGAWREIRRLPVSERTAIALWQRLRVPLPAERVIGPFDLFHGTDFVAPPTRRPTVVTIHDLSFLLHPEFSHPDLARYLTAAVPRALRKATQIITVSAAVAVDLAETFPWTRDRIVAVPNGVRKPDSSACEGATAQSRPQIIMVGTIEPRKNHRAALDAIRIVRAEIPDARLVITGRTGWRSEEIVLEIRRAVEAGEVIWHDNASDEQLEDLYRQASAALYPSHYEGFGLPVLEAMVRGVPVVASEDRALVETAGDAALFAPANAPDALADQLIRLLTDQALYTTLRERGLERASGLDWAQTAERTYRVYRRTMEMAQA